MLRWVTTNHPLVVPLLHRRRVLEVGTGTGMLSGFLALVGVQVTTVDLSEAVLGVANRFYDQLGVKVRTVQGDGASTGFEDDAFDAVFSQGLWEHFEDQRIRDFAAEGLRLAPLVYASIPSVAYPRIGHRGPGLVGNERFLSASHWKQILFPLDASASARYYADWKILTVIGATLPYPNHLLLELRRR
jgi:protein-L-isoaspartate O-methyltransferase